MKFCSHTISDRILKPINTWLTKLPSFEKLTPAEAQSSIMPEPRLADWGTAGGHKSQEEFTWSWPKQHKMTCCGSGFLCYTLPQYCQQSLTQQNYFGW